MKYLYHLQTSIHPAIHQTVFTYWVVSGGVGWGAYPLCLLGKRRDRSWTGHEFIAGANAETNNHSHSQTRLSSSYIIQFTNPQKPCLWMWKGSWNTMQNIQTPHIKATSPHGVLTTAPTNILSEISSGLNG